MRVPGSIAHGILASAALVILRIYLGVIFLVAAWPKLQSDFSPQLTRFLEKVALERGHHFYQEFVRGVVLPHLELFARLVSWGELLVGLALLLGVMTRIAAVMALLLA